MPRLLGLPGSDAVYAEAYAKLDEALEVYDQILGKQRYMAGDVRASELSSRSPFLMPLSSELHLGRPSSYPLRAASGT